MFPGRRTLEDPNSSRSSSGLNLFPLQQSEQLDLNLNYESFKLCQHDPATPLRAIDAESLETYLVNIKIKFEHMNVADTAKQGPKIDGFRKSPSKSHLIEKLKLAPPRPRITLRAERNKLYESIIIQNRLSS